MMLRQVASFLVLLTLAACAPAAPAPTAAPKPAATADSPKAAQPAPAKVAEKVAEKPKASAEWEQVIAAAKREGALSVEGPPGAETQVGYTAPFNKLYPEIAIEWSAGSGSQRAPKILAEREAGIFRPDLYLGGTTTALTSLGPANALDPLGPYLVGPDIQDQSKWLDGKYEFGDEGRQYSLVYVSQVNAPFAYHPPVVAADAVRSWWDLTEPKWRGKLSMRDPRAAGAGQSMATFMYLTPELGKDFMTKLFANNVTFSNDEVQILNWAARGEYPIGLAPSPNTAIEMIRKGLPLDLYNSDNLKEGSYIVSTDGNVAVFNKAPHPNAAKLYINWLLSQQGQTEMALATGYVSRRTDAPRDHVHPALLPKAGAPMPDHLKSFKEGYIKNRPAVAEVLKTAIPQ